MRKVEHSTNNPDKMERRGGGKMSPAFEESSSVVVGGGMGATGDLDEDIQDRLKAKEEEEEREGGRILTMEGERCFLCHQRLRSQEEEEEEEEADAPPCSKWARRKRRRSKNPWSLFLLSMFMLISTASASVSSSSSSKEVSSDPSKMEELFSVVKGTAHLPCNLTAPRATDGPRLVLWYKDGEAQPIYSYDARFSTIKHWSEFPDFAPRAEFR